MNLGVGRDESQRGRAVEKLLPLLYGELRQLAAARMAHEMAGQTLLPTALAHETWLWQATDNDRTWRNRLCQGLAVRYISERR
jgi:hypothetical protein